MAGDRLQHGVVWRGSGRDNSGQPADDNTHSSRQSEFQRRAAESGHWPESGRHYHWWTALNMRRTAHPIRARAAYLKSGAVVTIQAGPQMAEGFRWWQIQADDGSVGWVVDQVTDQRWHGEYRSRRSKQSKGAQRAAPLDFALPR